MFAFTSPKIAAAFYAAMWAVSALGFLLAGGMLLFSFGSFRQQTNPPNFEYQIGVGTLLLIELWIWPAILLIGVGIRNHYQFKRALIAASSVIPAIVALGIGFGLSRLQA